MGIFVFPTPGCDTQTKALVLLTNPTCCAVSIWLHLCFNILPSLMPISYLPWKATFLGGWSYFAHMPVCLPSGRTGNTGKKRQEKEGITSWDNILTPNSSSLLTPLLGTPVWFLGQNSQTAPVLAGIFSKIKRWKGEMSYSHTPSTHSM